MQQSLLNRKIKIQFGKNQFFEMDVSAKLLNQISLEYGCESEQLSDEQVFEKFVVILNNAVSKDKLKVFDLNDKNTAEVLAPIMENSLNGL